MALEQFLPRRTETPPRLEAEKIAFAYHGPESVLEEFAHHAVLAEKGIERKENDHSRWIILPGGGTKGALQGGQIESAVASGLFHGATDAAGMSAGAAALLHGASRNLDAAKIFFEDNFLKKFVDFNPLKILRREMLNFEGLEESFRDGFPINKEVLASCPVGIHLGVTPIEGDGAGTTQFIDVRKHHDPIAVLMASLNIPWIGNIKHVALERDGTSILHNDGGLADPLALKYAIDHGARHILYLMNSPWEQNKVQDLLAEVQSKIARFNPEPISRAIMSGAKKGQDDLKQAYAGEITLEDGSVVQVGIIAPVKDKVKAFEQNWTLLRRAVYDSREFCHELFGTVMRKARAGIVVEQPQSLSA